jgi:uncharacterized protein YcbK (DUF882 family)
MDNLTATASIAQIPNNTGVSSRREYAVAKAYKSLIDIYFRDILQMESDKAMDFSMRKMFNTIKVSSGWVCAMAMVSGYLSKLANSMKASSKMIKKMELGSTSALMDSHIEDFSRRTDQVELEKF